MHAVSAFNPDVIVGYNINFFDLPYIIDRSIINNISTSPLTRHNDEAYFRNDEGQKIINIRGRVVFDIFDEVLADQTLYGIADRKMKTVAKWFNVEKSIREDLRYKDYKIIVEETNNMRKLIGTQQLRDYSKSDILITRALSNFYFKNILMFSNMIKLPISTMSRRTASLINNVIFARELQKMNIVSDAANFQRHTNIFGGVQTERIHGRVKFMRKLGYQGALVGIFRKGIIENLYKIDYVGMYPSIHIAFNLSPETTKIIGYEDYKELYIKREGQYLILSFPDDKIKGNVIIRIDMSKRGFLAKMQEEFKAERKIIKKKLRDTDTPDYRKEELESRSWCLKVQANTAYGYNGSTFARYGDVSIAMATAGIGRHLAKLIVDWMGKRAINVDTDGVLVEGHVDIDKLNERIDRHMLDKFGLKCDIKLELEGPYPKGYFFKMKNYILLDDNDKIIKHGHAFKGSSKNKLFNIAMDKLCKAILVSGKQEDVIDAVCQSYQSVDDNDLSKFIMKTKINKPLKEYKAQPSKKSKGCVQIQVAYQVRGLIDAEINVGDMIEYVKETDGYKIKDTANVQKIDKPYYLKQIRKVLERLGLNQYYWDLGSKNILIQTDLTDINTKFI